MASVMAATHVGQKSLPSSLRIITYSKNGFPHSEHLTVLDEMIIRYFLARSTRPHIQATMNTSTLKTPNVISHTKTISGGLT